MVAIPEFSLSTKAARSVLPKTVGFADAIHNVSRSSMLVAAIATGKLEMLSLAMADRLHQPYRTSLVPGFDDVAESAMRAGALSVALMWSGSKHCSLLHNIIPRDRFANAPSVWA